MTSSRASSKSNMLRVPCCYQGGKQRIASQIVDRLLNHPLSKSEETVYYDLCCGSGAITIELINRGVDPKRIVMFDLSSWGAFWEKVGSGNYNLTKLKRLIDKIPEDKKRVKAHVSELAKQPISDDEAYVYPILQACSFGGKQIWLDNQEWRNAFFRDYWEPTSTSKRRSPANPMQPSPQTLYKRIESIAERCKGLTCHRENVLDALSLLQNNKASIVYIDPPYAGMTDYGFDLDIDHFVDLYTSEIDSPLFVSENRALSDNALRIDFRGAKGGISGSKPSKHDEWLSVFNNDLQQSQ